MNTKIEPIVKPFYINNCTLTAAQREDLHKRCIAAGAVEERTLEEAGWCAWVGVDEDFNFTGWDCEVNFTSYGVPETTYAQVGKYVGGQVGFTEELLALCTKHAKLTLEGSGEYTNPYLVQAIAVGLESTSGEDFDFLYDWASELFEL